MLVSLNNGNYIADYSYQLENNFLSMRHAILYFQWLQT